MTDSNLIKQITFILGGINISTLYKKSLLSQSLTILVGDGCNIGIWCNIRPDLTKSKCSSYTCNKRQLILMSNKPPVPLSLKRAKWNMTELTHHRGIWVAYHRPGTRQYLSKHRAPSRSICCRTPCTCWQPSWRIWDHHGRTWCRQWGRGLWPVV